MKISAQSELMTNQKHASLMEPQRAFQVLQTDEGDSLFFSISSSGSFHVTRQLRGSDSGWNKIDLSAPLNIPSPGKVKSFAAAQNPSNLRIDLALVVTDADGQDTLYTSLDNPHTTADWEHGVNWTKLLFDDPASTPPSQLQIESVYLLSIPKKTTGDIVSCFVDIVRDPKSNVKLLDRYWIRPQSSPHWARHRLPHDVQANSIVSCLGRRSGDRVAGIYTFGHILDDTSLLYTPEHNPWRPDTPPTTSRLNLPADASSITPAVSPQGTSNLFVAAGAGLYMFAADNQLDGAEPLLVIPSSPVSGTNTFEKASSLQATSVDSRTVVWGRSTTGDLIYASCQAGQEQNQTAWSPPMRLCAGVDTFSFYLNTHSPGNTLFVQTQDEKLLQYTEDHETSAWSSYRITLPAMDPGDMMEQPTFTSHIQVNTDNGLPAVLQSVEIQSSSLLSVYVNNVYQKLSPGKPVTVKTDATGALTVIQLTQSIAAASLKVSCEGESWTVDPQSKVREKLSIVKSGDDLSKIEIKDPEGRVAPLVPSDVSANDLTSAAKSLTQLLDIQSNLPSDGSVKSLVTMDAAQETPPRWGALCGPNGFQYLEEEELQTNDILDGLPVGSGVLFGFLKSVWHGVEKFVVEPFKGVYRFVVWIGKKIYTAILDCIEVVGNAIEFVFTQIKVFFESLFQWLSFLFDWDDILRTHSVFKNMIRQYSRHAVDQIDGLQGLLQEGFESVRHEINTWADLPDTGKTIGEYQQEGGEKMGSDSTTKPQSNWAMYHMSNGLSKTSTSGHLPGWEGDIDLLSSLFHTLEVAVKNETEEIKSMLHQMRAEIAEQITSLSPVQLIQKLLGIVGKFILNSTENYALRLLDIIKIAISGFLDLLEAPIEIPILSKIYEKAITKGDKLSFLDLTCLVTAIPATILFKIFAKRTPFPDDQNTKALINAPDFPTLTNLLSPTQEQKVSATATAPDLGTTAAAALKLTSVVTTHANVILSLLKRGGEISGSNTVVRAFTISFWFAGAIPGLSGFWLNPTAWTTIFGGVLTGLGACKCLFDNSSALSKLGPASVTLWGETISPLLATVLGVLGFVPTIASYASTTEKKLQHGLALGGGLCSSTSGSITFLASRYIDPEFADIVWGISQMIIIVGGVCNTSGGGVSLIPPKKDTHM